MTYPESTIYILGNARISKNDPIADLYHTFFLGIITEREDGVIVDITSNMVKDVTTDFIRSMLVGYRLSLDIDDMIQQVETRFFGMAQKAVIAALKDARNKYIMVKKV